MKIAVVADIHDNLIRWEKAAGIIQSENIKVGICCGDVSSLEKLIEISKSFEKLYLVFGNEDYRLIDKTSLFPENIEFFSKKKEKKREHFNDFWVKSVGRIKLENRNIIFTHSNSKFLAQEIAHGEKPDIIFYGHTHTPWEEKKDEMIFLCPGEICGRYGQSTFAIYDLSKMKAKLVILK